LICSYTETLKNKKKTEKRATNQDQYVQEVWKNKDEDHHSDEDNKLVDETDFADQTPNTNEVGEPKKGSRDWADWDNKDNALLEDDQGGDGGENNDW